MIFDEEIFFRQCEGRVELNVFPESSRLHGLAGINFCSFKCFSERTSLLSELFVDFEGF